MFSAGKVAQIAVALALPSSALLFLWWFKQSSSGEKINCKKKDVTSKNTIIEVVVPQQAVGAVIGRQGANIKQIQRETRAHLYFKDLEEITLQNSHRVLVIQGTHESVQHAELMVYQILSELPEIVTEEIEISHSSLGRLIGKEGTTIHAVQRCTGAKIAINRVELTDLRLPHVIRITGSRQQIDQVMVIIQHMLEEELCLSLDNSVSKELIKTTEVQRDNELREASKDILSPNQNGFPLKADYIEVFVSAVEHPGHFWVQVFDERALQLEELHRDIISFINSDDAKLNYQVSEALPGELVAAKYEEDDDSLYYRAKVLGETNDGKLDLYFVDYGDNAFARKEDIFKLRSDFTNFPYQAIECQLANVDPVGGEWSEEGITCFEDLTYCAQWKILLAHSVAYKHINEHQVMPVIRLLDTNRSEEIDIGHELIRQGYAVPVASAARHSQNATNLQSGNAPQSFSPVGKGTHSLKGEPSSILTFTLLNGSGDAKLMAL